MFGLFNLKKWLDGKFVWTEIQSLSYLKKIIPDWVDKGAPLDSIPVYTTQKNILSGFWHQNWYIAENTAGLDASYEFQAFKL